MLTVSGWAGDANTESETSSSPTGVGERRQSLSSRQVDRSVLRSQGRRGVNNRSQNEAEQEAESEDSPPLSMTLMLHPHESG